MYTVTQSLQAHYKEEKFATKYYGKQVKCKDSEIIATCASSDSKGTLCFHVKKSLRPF